MKINIVRSRRKTLSLSVNKEAQVIVRAPLYVKEEEVYSFIQKHQAWINTRLLEIEKNKLNLADGANLTLFGIEYTIACGKCAVRNGYVFLPEESREEALIRLLKSLAKKEMKMRTAEFAAKYGFQYLSVRISSARSRWGSCNKRGNISYSFRIALLPSELVDYIVVHELCHTRCFNHSVQFWREVEQVIPDYKLRRKALKGHSQTMNLL